MSQKTLRLQIEIVCAQAFDYIIQLWQLNTTKTLQESIFNLQPFTSVIETFKLVETKVWWVRFSGSKTQPKDISVRLWGIRWQDDVLETATLEIVRIAGNSSRGIKQMDAQDKMLALDARLRGDLRWHFALTGKKNTCTSTPLVPKFIFCLILSENFQTAEFWFLQGLKINVRAALWFIALLVSLFRCIYVRYLHSGKYHFIVCVNHSPFVSPLR